MIFETHIHICDDRYDADRDEMLDRAREKGVQKFINIGAELKECRKVAEYREEGVYNAIGLHPHYIEELNDGVLEEFRGYLKNRNIIAIGEIGLDYFKSPVPKEVQGAGFKKLLGLAKESGLPVIIHSRDAHEEVYSALKEYKLPGGIVHCFTGGLETAHKFIELGFLIGIGGVLTFPNAGNLKDTVKSLPLENIVLETDAPWLAPQKVRGKRNEAAFLEYIVDAVAEIKGAAREKVEEITTGNAIKLFNV